MVHNVVLPLAIYVISAVLLFMETSLVSRALEHVQRVPDSSTRTVAMACLLLPLILLPLVPLVYLLTLDLKGQSTPESFIYTTAIWAGGIIAALPSYWYLTRRRKAASK